MHLTQEDLNAISGIVKQEIKQEIKPVNEKLDNLEKRVDSIDNRLGVVETKVDNIDNRLGVVELKVDKLEADNASLASGQKQIRKDIKRLEDKIDATYDLALEAWGKSTENRTWIEAAAKA